MKKEILLAVFICLTFPAWAQYTVSGGEGTPFHYTDVADREMQVYLLDGLANARIGFQSDGSSTHQWYKYRSKASEAEPIDSDQAGNTSYITGLEDGYGYFVGDINSPSTRYVWIVDYSQYLPQLKAIAPNPNDDSPCSRLTLVLDLEAKALNYTSALGYTRLVNRLYELDYQTLKWNSETQAFHNETVVETLTNPSTEIEVKAPLQNTSFTLSGDQFARHFGKEINLESETYEAKAVEVWVEAYPDGEEMDDGMYQAPLRVEYVATANEPTASLYSWKVYHQGYDASERVLVKREEGNVLDYVFERAGTFTIEIEVYNSDLSCMVSDEQEIRISESLLTLPNFFTPGAESNNFYRVKHKSLLSFHASIFNRWGNLIYEWSDPDDGWDGRVAGKFVPTGAYYIIVEAKGADGKNYKKSSDINLLRENKK